MPGRKIAYVIRSVLYVGSRFEGSTPERGPSLNSKAFFESFLQLGYSIVPVWYDDTKGDLQAEILSAAARLNPDMIFFILQEDQVRLATLKKLRDMGNFLVNFFGDDQWRFDGFTNKYANAFSVCITTDKFSLGKYEAIGQRNVVSSQWASLPSSVDYRSHRYEYDISFIGGHSLYRKWFVNSLRARGLAVHCFGDRWENGRISYADMESIFVSSKINLNISNSVQYDIRYLLSSPRNVINTLRGKKNQSQMKARIFEIPAHGGFELTEYVPSLEDYFDIGRDLACYKDVDEAERQIRYYLKNEDEREEVKARGAERARTEHLFPQRVEKFMAQIEAMKATTGRD